MNTGDVGSRIEPEGGRIVSGRIDGRIATSALAVTAGSAQRRKLSSGVGVELENLLVRPAIGDEEVSRGRTDRDADWIRKAMDGLRDRVGGADAGDLVQCVPGAGAGDHPQVSPIIKGETLRVGEGDGSERGTGVLVP